MWRTSYSSRINYSGKPGDISRDGLGGGVGDCPAGLDALKLVSEMEPLGLLWPEKSLPKFDSPEDKFRDI